MSADPYGQFLLSSRANYPSAQLADHLKGLHGLFRNQMHYRFTTPFPKP